MTQQVRRAHNTEAQAHWEEIYKTGARTPWESAEIPMEIHMWIRFLPLGSRVLDMGCGTGSHTLTMAEAGFQVTGIDFSISAIAAARRKARQRQLQAVKFVLADILSFGCREPYDFAFDYSVFHHISEQDRESYAATIGRVLKPGGFLAIVCYSDQDSDAKGVKSRVGRYGNVIHHPTIGDIERLFMTDYETIIREATLLGRSRDHVAHHLILRRLR